MKVGAVMGKNDVAGINKIICVPIKDGKSDLALEKRTIS